MQFFGIWPRGPFRPLSQLLPLLLLILSVLLTVLFPVESITITTVYAGKKKFKSYSLGIKFLPTLVKVKPNRLALSFRQSRYIRPPKFKIEGSIPFKIPTIIMERPDPNAKPQIININKTIKLGVDKDQSDGGDYKAAGTNEQKQMQEAPSEEMYSSQSSPDHQQHEPLLDGHGEQLPQTEPGHMPFFPPSMPHFLPPSFPMVPPMMPLFGPNMPNSLSSFTNHDLMSAQAFPLDQFKARSHTRTKRSLNLKEPYHHYLNPFPQFRSHASPSPQMEPLHRPFGFPQYAPVRGPFPPPRSLYMAQRPMWPLPWQSGSMEKQDLNSPEQQQFVMNEAAPIEPVASSVVTHEESLVEPKDQRSIVPMKINIGEHYNPNQVYMDESIMPNLEDVPLIDPVSLGEPIVEESMNHEQYYHKPAYKEKDTGPDDFRVDFNFSGVHGGPLVPLGTGDDIEQFYRHLKKFEGNNLPVGLPPEQISKYYRAHTFTNGIHAYKVTPVKVIKAKLIKALFG